MRHPVSATQGMTEARSTASVRHHGRLWTWAGFVVLFAIHHDFWWWGDRSLVLGFMPIGLAYHAAFSIAAGVLWALACRHAWPEHLEAWAEKSSRVGELAEGALAGKGGDL